MKKLPIIVLPIVLVLSSSCAFNKKKLPVITKATTKVKFKDVFTPLDSVEFTEKDSIKSILSITLDHNHNMILCDYGGEQILKYNFDKKLLSKLNDSINHIKLLMHPISCTTDENGNLYVASNGNRRILIFDSSDALKGSFLMSGDNIVPVTLRVKNGKVYMGGFSLMNKKLIHIYDTTGKDFKDFLMQPKGLENTKFGEALNYPFFDFSNGNIWTVQAMKYVVKEFDSNGNLKSQFLFKPQYYVSLTKDIEKMSKIELPTMLFHKFCRQICLFNLGKVFLVEVEMPRNNVDDNSYLNGAEFRLDIFDSLGKSLYSGIQLDNELLYVDQHQKICYFLTKINYEKMDFEIKRFKFNL